MLFPNELAVKAIHTFPQDFRLFHCAQMSVNPAIFTEQKKSAGAITAATLSIYLKK